MQPNNNPLTEIFALIVAALLIVAGAVLMFFGKIDWPMYGVMFGAALALFGYNAALKAPSPVQQAALAQLVSQAMSQQAQPAQLVQAPAPVAMPQFVPNPIDPKFGIMPQAIQTTGIMPVVPKQ